MTRTVHFLHFQQTGDAGDTTFPRRVSSCSRSAVVIWLRSMSRGMSLPCRDESIRRAREAMATHGDIFLTPVQHIRLIYNLVHIILAERVHSARYNRLARRRNHPFVVQIVEWRFFLLYFREFFCLE